MTFRRGMKVDLCMGYNYTHGSFDDLDLDARSVGRQRQKLSCLFLATKQAIGVKLATTVGFFNNFYLTLTFISLHPWLVQLVFKKK